MFRNYSTVQRKPFEEFDYAVEPSYQITVVGIQPTLPILHQKSESKWLLKNFTKKHEKLSQWAAVQKIQSFL